MFKNKIGFGFLDFQIQISFKNMFFSIKIEKLWRFLSTIFREMVFFCSEITKSVDIMDM